MFETERFKTQLLIAEEAKSKLLGRVSPLVASMYMYTGQRAETDFANRVALRQISVNETIEQSETFVQVMMEQEILALASAFDAVSAPQVGT